MKRTLKKLTRRYFPALFDLLKRRRYEKHVLPKEFVKHVRRLSKNDVVLDCGANVGLVSEFLARSGARVISFEPNMTAFRELESRSKKFPNIEVHNVAVSTVNQTGKLYLHKDVDRENRLILSEASSLLNNKPNVSSHIFEEIHEIDFAEFLKQFNFIELIKIDIEGFEIEVLNHLLDKQAVDNVGSIYVETHERKFKELAVPTQKLKARIASAGHNNKFYFNWH